jgi:hypothetical protein
MPAAQTTTPAPKAADTASSAFGYVIDTAQKSGEQMLDYYLQTAKFALDAGSGWMSTLSSLPLVTPASDAAPAAVKATAEKFVTASFAMVDHAVKVQKELSAQALALIDS